MNLLVCGSRVFDNYQLLKDTLDSYLQDKNDVTLISGHAKGADDYAEQYFNWRKLPIKRFPADWSQGKAAGMIRNREMAKVADECIAFLAPNVPSKGTKDMIQLMKNLNKPVKIIQDV